MTCSDAVVRARLLCMQDKWTALVCAALKGHPEVAKVLLDHGAQVDIQDKVMNVDG